LMLAPFAPHMAEELWRQLGHAETLAYEKWPEANGAFLVQSELEIVLQVNGKVRGHFLAQVGMPQKVLEDLARTQPAFAEWVGEKTVRKVVAVPDKLINFVVG
jgi:leucyl-tRNA synthetase